MTKKALRHRLGLVWVCNKIFGLLDFICSFLEMHLVKIVSFAIMALCCSVVNALHLIPVVLLLLCCLFGISALRYSFSFIGPFLSLLFLAKMLYQTKFLPQIIINTNCSALNISLETKIQNTILDPEWWGFVLLKKGQSLISAYRGYILVFLVMTLQTVIRTRQKISRIDAGEPPDTPQILFPQTSRQDADKSLRECLKFLLNYGFYKFGIEITLSFCVFVIAFRNDVFSVLYAIWIVILFLPHRSTLAMIWPFFLTTMIFSVMWQYGMAVGLSKKTCFEYPWADQESLTVWLFLPSFQYPPDTKKTLVDFVLLLLVQRQQAVFEIERRHGDKYLGGSNKEVYMDYYNRDFVNPTPDHTGNKRSWIDVAKFLFLTCLFRITLAFEFWNGASNANLLSLGYLVGAFVFLWIDYDLCLWNIKKILKWWNVLLGYTVFVIFLKTLLEFAGCVYWDVLEKNAIWSIELLFLHCSSPNLKTISYQSISSFYWDVVCFSLALFQRRYFQSHYFLHELEDVLGVVKLQAKGAKLMDELQENKLKEFQLRERKTLSKIKKNMNRIKAWQKRMQGLNYNEPTDHATAIYMGDYLMFEDLEDVSSQVDETSSSSEEDEFDEDLKENKVLKKLTMTEFIGNVFKRTGEDSNPKIDKKKESVSSKEEDAEEKNQKKEKIDEKNQKPGSSKKEIKKPDDKKSGDEMNPEESKSVESEEGKEKVKKCCKLFRSFIDSVMVSLIRFFNKNSRDYRFVQSMMKAERKLQKKIKRDLSRDRTESGSRKLSGPLSGNKIDTENVDSRRLSIKSHDSREDELDEPKKSSQALLVSLINAICMFIMSKTELLCYMIIFLHTVLSPTLISLPLPLLVFLWGSLTTIRPTTTFWTVLIAYTEVTVVIKALFQNSIFPWNTMKEKNTIRPEYPPLFLGIHRDNQYVVADLFLLLLLFLHRYKLKTLGLWNRTHEEETQPPHNLMVYKELPSEVNNKGDDGDRSLTQQKKKMVTGLTDINESVTHFQMATWKCTSRATAKLTYWGNKLRINIRVKEIEGPILVTHDGRRLEPTYVYVSQASEEALEGSIVLRVYVNDIISETRNLVYRLSWVQHFTSVRKFFIQILVRDWRMSADFYTLMFVFEFLNFLIVFFGYSTFTDSVEIVSEDFSLAENQVPPMYLFTMIVHFLVIIIDRILYLRKSVIGKLVLQIILVILVHVWMFILIPIVTESPFNSLHVPQTYYIISCFYFLMSAYQLRVGYPLRNQGHFLCKKYGYVNYYAYKGLQLIPFFNQLRTLLDFVCIQSSLTMMEWIRMESIFQLVYENKCSRRADIYYPVPRGEECPNCSKYTPGIFVLCGMIIVIWLPFIVFALFNTVAQPNLPQEASIELQIGNFGKIYVTKATFTDIITFTESQFRSLQSLYKDNKKVWALLSLYDHRDVGVLKFRFQPYKPWTITPQELQALNQTIQNIDIPISMYITWRIQRIPRSQIVANAKGYLEIILNKTNPARQQLADTFLNRSATVRLNRVLPKFIHVTNEGEAKPIMGFLHGNNTNGYRNVTLTLEEDGAHRWWKLVELCDDGDEWKIKKIPFQSSNEITIYTFNEKNIPKLLLNVSKKGIIGLYLSIVFVTWTLFKRLMWKYPYIMFDHMPNPDLVLKLCHDIYLARENHEFALEEDLYAKLLFLFRSPETMIKFTRLSNVNA